MAWMLCHGTCYGCRKIFSYNPDRVPSVRIDGVREPLCRACMAELNTQRESEGLDAHYIDAEAYEPQECV